MFRINKRTMQTGKAVREEQLDGRDYLVFPVVMMVEGVHVNSGGASYYESEQLAKHPESWNTKPVVVFHPDDGGVPVSACSKEVLEKQSIGLLLNTSFDEGKLKSEAWIDQNKAEKVYPGLITTLRSGAIMEVSIGHFTEDVSETGMWNNEEYNRKVVSIKPDHLALLPTERGACSVQDGAGIPRINKDFRTNQDMAHDEIRMTLYDALRDAGVGSNEVFLESVYDDYFVYGIYDSDKLWKRTYTLSDNSVELGSAEEVRRLIEYVTVNHKETKSMDDKLKELLTANGFSAESLATLEGLPKEELEVLSARFAKPKEEPPKETPVVNQEPVIKPDMTVNEFLSKTPEQFREVLTEGVRLQAVKKQELVRAITANSRNKFTKEDLEKESLSKLEMIASLAQEPDYTLNGAVTHNQGVVTTEEPLPEISLGGKEV